MNHVTMIKTKDHPDIKLGGLPLEALVGLSANNENTVTEHGYRPNGCETEEVLSAPSDAIEYIINFFYEKQAKSPENRLPYNCHSFASYSPGKLATVQGSACRPI